MIIKNTIAAADKIASKSDTSGITEYIDDLSRENSILVFVIDTDGNILYSSDEYKKGPKDRSGEFNPVKAEFRGERGRYRELPENYDEFLSRLADSDDDEAELRSGDLYVYGRYISFCGSDEKAVLYIGTTLNAVGSTARIIRIQLLWVTALSVMIGFVLAWFMSRSFSRPVAQLNEKAHKLGEKSDEVPFRDGFCAELDELNDTLDTTAEKLRRSQEFQHDLLANVSHDLRTPLTMIKGYAEMIRDLSGDDPKKRTEHIQIIIDEADRLSALVNNLLELSKLESGNMELEITDFSIVDKINDCMTRYTLLIEQNGYDIKYEPDEDRIISADINKLDQVIYNFINNAINYTGDNKVIRIKQINLENCVRIEVTDNGSGISKEMLPLIFDRYYRDAKVKRAVVGTGLGLSICKEILKKHGFAFGVSSVEGKGSTFWFEAPYARTRTDSKAAGRLESRLTYGGNNEKQGGE